MNEIRKTGHLITESVNPNTTNIDELSTSEIVELISSEDQAVLEAVNNQKVQISRAIDLVFDTLSNGGRMFFIGAGTSGRLGVLEAAECPPTFGTEPEMIQAVIAGGRDAVWSSIEGAEDSELNSKNELEKKRLNSRDVVVGIAASSTTPYVKSAIEYASSINCGTILISCNPLERKIADISIELPVGPEVIVGSTRLKSGTATKMVLNMITTSVMVKMGKTYGNLMVDVQPKSSKLKDRAVRIVMDICGIDRDEAQELLMKSSWNVKVSIVMNKKNLDPKQSLELLNRSHGILKNAIK